MTEAGGSGFHNYFIVKDMEKKRLRYFPILLVLIFTGGFLAAGAHYLTPESPAAAASATGRLLIGAERTGLYVPLLRGKRVGMVINNTSVIDGRRSVDSLLSLGVHVVRLYGPEHGFRGAHSAATPVDDSRDSATGLPVVSIFGNHVKPTPEDLKGVDILVFDMQDVGVRFYTYLSTLHYVMEACAENDIPLIVLDRPNPNDYYVDGPILDPRFKSFIGVDPIPIVHGLTLGEYAKMANGEGWLKGREKCDLTVIPMSGYHHGMGYRLPGPPSPNLRDQQAILLYPTLCLFGGTVISDGRGTHFPFEMIGNPELKGKYSFSYTPVPMPGMTEHPPMQGRVCYGLDLRHFDTQLLRKSGRLHLSWVLEFYKAYPNKVAFFLRESTGDSTRIGYHFDELAGTDQLRKQIIAGKSLEEIHASWEPGLSRFKAARKKYLIYP